MARHRVGNTFLSDKEKQEYDDSGWAAIVFLIGALIGGCTVHELIKPLAFAKWGVFVSVIAAGITLGSILVIFRRVLAFCLQAVIFIGVVWFVGFVIWKLI